MAKFAVLFIAALAFQATLAGVVRPYASQYFDNQVGQHGSYQPGQLQSYVSQIQAVANELSAAFQYAHPNSMKSLTWQSRELAQAVEQIIDRLQAEINTHSGAVDGVLEQVFSELRQIQFALRKTADYVDTTDAHKYQYQLSAYVQEVAHQVEKLVYLVQYHHPEAQGSLYATIQTVIAEFLATIQHIKTQAFPQDYQGGLYGQGVYQGEFFSHKYGQIGHPMGLYGYSGYGFRQAGKGLAIQLQVVASDLSAALQHVYADNAVVRQSLAYLVRQYVQHLEVVVESLEQVSYASGADVAIQHQVAQHLRQIIASLQQVVYSGASVNTYELRSQLSLYVQNIASELKKLTYGVQPEVEQLVGVKLSIVRFLTATRHFYVQIQYISQVAHRGQSTTGFGYQIQTLANGLTAALESISVDNKQARQVLAEQSRELAQHLENIIEKIHTVTYETQYGASVPQQVAANLRHIVASLQQVADFENVSSAYKLKMHFIANIQDAATEIQKLLWVGQQSFQGQAEFHGTPIYTIFNDFVAALQNQQIQIQGMYQFSKYGQGAQQLSVQIQAITNNLAIFLQSAPFQGEHARQVEIQARRLAHNIEYIIQRLEVESMYTHEHGVFQQVVSQLRQIVASLEKVAVFETSGSAYELSSQFHLFLQQVASVMKKLAYAAQYDSQYTQGNFYGVVRSVLVQYLNVIQHAQLQIQGINQIVQIGQTPRELGLQIQVVAHRLSGMLHVVSDSRQTYGTLAYQARRFSQIIEIIANKLQAEATTGSGKAYYVFQQVANNLHQIHMSLYQAIAHVEGVSPFQMRVHLAARIQDAAVEIQKLMFVAPYEVPQVQGGAYTLVKSVLIDFLAGLHTLQMQVQDNLQIVLNGQNPRALAIQIQSVAQRLFAYLQYAQAQAQPHSQQFRQILVIQIGQFAQAIEHAVQMLQTEIKNSEENCVTLKQVVADLNKITLSLQQANGFESHVPVHELSAQLYAQIQKVVAEFHRLAYAAQYKLQVPQANAHYAGALNGVFNNVLGTLRNIFVQMQSARYMGYYGQSAQQLATQIETVTNNLAQTLPLVGVSSKTVKQALAIQTFRYARHIYNIVEKLESEVSYRSEFNVATFQQVAQNLKQVAASLQQIAGTWTTATTADLRTQLVTEVQHADAQIQKLVVAQSAAQQYQSYANTVVKSVLIEYYAAVQNFNIRIHTIAHISQKGQTIYQLAIQMETAAIELSAFFQHVLPSNRLVAQTISVEARQLAKVLESIVNKFQSFSAAGNYGLVQQIAAQLKHVQFSLQQLAGVQTFANVHQQKIQLEANVHRAVIAIQQLVWAVQPQFEQTALSTGVYSLVKEAFVEFLAVVQNVQIQIQNVVHNGQTRQFSWGWGFQTQQEGQQYPEQYYAGWRFYAPSYGQNRLVGGQQYYGYYGGLGMFRGQIAQSPRQYYFYIQSVLHDLSAALQSSALNTQQAKQIVAEQARQFAQIIEQMVNQLEQHFENGSETVVQQVIYNLREVQQALRKAVGYTVFTNVHQLKTELESYIQTAAAQIEKLVYFAQQVPQGKFYFTIKSVLADFLNGIQHIQMQIQSGAQYSQYGKKYGYAGQYDSEYGYASGLAQYGKGYGYAGQYRPYGYGYAGKYDQYDSQYGYEGQYYPYGQKYGYSGKYDQYDSQYGYEGQYYPYGQKYGYSGKYDKHDNEYGYEGQYYPYGQKYGYSGKYDQYDSQYGYEGQYYPYGQKYGFSGKYDQYDSEHGYAGQYRPYGYGFSGKYDQYASQYGHEGQYYPYGQNYGYGYGYAQQYAQQYDNQYGYPGYSRPYAYGYGYVEKYNPYDDEYAYSGLYRPYGYESFAHSTPYGYGLAGQYRPSGYGYSSQYQPYGYGYEKYGKYDNEYGYAGQYDNEFAGQYRPYGYGYEKYGKSYDNEYAGQYENQYGYAGQYSPYKQGFAGKYDQYDNEYSYAGQYDNEFSGKYYGMKYGYQGQSLKYLAKQVETFAQQIAGQFQTVAGNSQQFRQIAIYQARQLVHVIDNIVDRLQAEASGYSTVQQVISGLREIQSEVQQIVSSGVLTTVYQIKAQFATYIEKVAAKLQKLALYADSDVQVQDIIVKNVIVQYLAYLRSVQYQVQGKSYQFEGAYQGAYQGAYPGYQGAYQGAYQSAYPGYEGAYQGSYQSAYPGYEGAYQGAYQTAYPGYEGAYQGSYQSAYPGYEGAYQGYQGAYSSFYPKYQQDSIRGF